jgi:hypothetical protein
MPSERDEAVGTERIRVMPVASGGTQKFTTNLTQTALQLAAVPGGIFAHRSGGEYEFVAESGRDGTSGFEQGFQMRLGSLLKSKGGFATVAPVCVATGQYSGFGNPDAVFIPTELYFREWNDHNGLKVTPFALDVKGDGCGARLASHDFLGSEFSECSQWMEIPGVSWILPASVQIMCISGCGRFW